MILASVQHVRTRLVIAMRWETACRVFPGLFGDAGEVMSGHADAIAAEADAVLAQHAVILGHVADPRRYSARSLRRLAVSPSRTLPLALFHRRKASAASWYWPSLCRARTLDDFAAPSPTL